MTDHSSNLAIQIEIQNARVARTNGNEGRARVCARRAAGIALREYFVKHSLPVDGLSGYQLLQVFLKLPDIPTGARQNAINLTSRVTGSFQMPEDIDLISEALSFCNYLEKL
jgi:hypothetical protein